MSMNNISIPRVKICCISSIEEAKIAIGCGVHALGLVANMPGGTGRTHDWSVSTQICRQVNIPVFLAGGLNPDNVKGAIELVKPFAVDVCSGVRTNDKLDESKVSAFIQNVKSI